MPRRTPLEVFINAQTDRQAAYEKRRREAGFTKTCVWLPAEDVAEFKEMARQRVAAKDALQTVADSGSVQIATVSEEDAGIEGANRYGSDWRKATAFRHGATGGELSSTTSKSEREAFEQGRVWASDPAQSAPVR